MEHTYEDIPVLDHGFVRLVEAWGGGDYMCDNEAGIIEAARQSTQGSFRGWEEDSRLLRFLYNNKHMSPFEFAGMVIEVKAPIFVFREWMRHRVFSFNEMSARYAPLPNVNYVPSVKRIMMNGGANKQAGAVAGSEAITETNADLFRCALQASYENAQQDYDDALAAGVPKELARCLLPVGRYSQMRATANLRNWLQFLALRLSPQAQWEIREYAMAVSKIIADQFPQVWELFNREMTNE